MAMDFGLLKCRENLRRMTLLLDMTPMKKTLMIGTLLISLVLSACASGKRELGTAGGTLSVADRLPEPVTRNESGEPLAFQLGADDLVAVKVFGSEEASVERVRIDRSGRLSVPIAGVVNATGLTLDELESLIEMRLRERFFRNPDVSINLLEIESAKITIDGQVAKPGLYPAVANMTLMQAVASAEGTKETADLNEVVIFRTVDNQKYAALYDLRAIRRGNYEDPKVFANDVVSVGDSASKRLFRDILQVVPLLTTPLILLLQQN
jgi:polysaccharide biosynthesis/export protein